MDAYLKWPIVGKFVSYRSYQAHVLQLRYGIRNATHYNRIKLSGVALRAKKLYETFKQEAASLMADVDCPLHETNRRCGLCSTFRCQDDDCEDKMPHAVGDCEKKTEPARGSPPATKPRRRTPPTVRRTHTAHKRSRSRSKSDSSSSDNDCTTSLSEGVPGSDEGQEHPASLMAHAHKVVKELRKTINEIVAEPLDSETVQQGSSKAADLARQLEDVMTNIDFNYERKKKSGKDECNSPLKKRNLWRSSDDGESSSDEEDDTANQPGGAGEAPEEPDSMDVDDPAEDETTYGLPEQWANANRLWTRQDTARVHKVNMSRGRDQPNSLVAIIGGRLRKPTVYHCVFCRIVRKPGRSNAISPCFKTNVVIAELKDADGAGLRPAKRGTKSCCSHVFKQ